VSLLELELEFELELGTSEVPLLELELGVSVMTLLSSPEHAKSVNIAAAKYARIQRFFMYAP
jgi:hypothetical protein